MAAPPSFESGDHHMINRALRLVRQYHDISITQLANELQLPKSSIDAVESGSKPVDEHLLAKYSQRFDIPITSLVMFSTQINNEKKIARKLRKSLAGKILDIAEWKLNRDEKIKA